eukprot:TRINITY_DN9463_c0_g1_i1.p1 TRINITY_DN9463_c0_g1~~TRINITY_DN9463_c0_g1_i1.p1  ORF type:complete len:394 (+),score=66.26 TRINITY_DN9463_c0_g1_i1:37-1182(+)
MRLTTGVVVVLVLVALSAVSHGLTPKFPVDLSTNLGLETNFTSGNTLEFELEDSRYYSEDSSLTMVNFLELYEAQITNNFNQDTFALTPDNTTLVNLAKVEWEVTFKDLTSVEITGTPSNNASFTSIVLSYSMLSQYSQLSHMQLTVTINDYKWTNIGTSYQLVLSGEMTNQNSTSPHQNAQFDNATYLSYTEGEYYLGRIWSDASVDSKNGVYQDSITVQFTADSSGNFLAVYQHFASGQTVTDDNFVFGVSTPSDPSPFMNNFIIPSSVASGIVHFFEGLGLFIFVCLMVLLIISVLIVVGIIACIVSCCCCAHQAGKNSSPQYAPVASTPQSYPPQQPQQPYAQYQQQAYQQPQYQQYPNQQAPAYQQSQPPKPANAV